MKSCCLTRREYVSTSYFYRMHISATEAASYSKYINETYILDLPEEEKIVLTVEDILKAWKQNYNEDDKTLTIKVKGYKDGSSWYTRPLEIGELLRDILNDDMWDVDYEQGDSYTEEVNDDFYITNIGVI